MSGFELTNLAWSNKPHTLATPSNYSLQEVAREGEGAGGRKVVAAVESHECSWWRAAG